MKTLYPILFLLLFISHGLFAQPAEFFFGEGRFHHVTSSLDGHYLLLGESENRISLKKINTAAEVIWEKNYPPTDSEQFEKGNRLFVLQDGKMLIVGESRLASGFGSKQALAALVDSEGEEIWKQYYSDFGAFFDGIVNEEGFLVVGVERGFGFYDGNFSQLDIDGELKWSIVIDVEARNYVKRIFSMPDGNYLLAGRANSTGSSFRGFFLRKVEPKGGQLWEVAEPTPFREDFLANENNSPLYPMGVSIDTDNSIWITDPYGDRDIGLWHFSDTGELLENTTFVNDEYKEYPLSLNLLSSGEKLIVGYAESNIGTTPHVGFALRLSAENEEVWRKYYKVEEEYARLLSATTLPNGQFFVCGMSNLFFENIPQSWLLRIEENGNALPWQISGNVAFDLDNNCLLDEDDIPAKGWFLTADNGKTTEILRTDSLGNFQMNTKDATTVFTLSPISPKEAWTVCENEKVVVSDHEHPEENIQFIVQQADFNCPIVEVSLTQPDMVRCEESHFFATVKNKAFSVSEMMVLEIELDDDLTLQTVSLPYTLTNQTAKIEIEPLPRLSEQTLEIETLLNCEANLGDAHLVKAHIYPLSCESDETQAVFEVVGECRGEEVVFELQNIGGGGAEVLTNYNVLADGFLAAKEVSVNLPEGGEKTEITFPADGRTWRVELQGLGESSVRETLTASIEGCGKAKNGLHTTGVKDAFFMDNHFHEKSYILPTNTTGVPHKISPFIRGYGRYNLIHELKPLEFTARVYNSSKITAQQVSFVLHITPSFDLTTFEILASSSPTSFRLLGGDSLEIVMKNAQLEWKETAQCRFRIHPRLDIPPDFGYSSFLSIEGRAFLDEQEPILLPLGYLNYSQEFPTEVDEFNLYPPQIQLYGGRYLDFASVVEEAEDGSIFLGGETLSYSDQTYYSGLLVKTNPFGKAIWMKVVNLDGGTAIVRGIAPLADGGCMVIGSSRLPSATTNYLRDYTPFIARISEDGEMLWYKKIRPLGESNGAFSSGLLQTSDNNFLMFGESEILGGSSANSEFYVKFDEFGEIIWRTTSPGYNFRPYKGIELEDGSFVFIGAVKNDNFSQSFNLRKIGANGVKIWHTLHTSEQSFYIGGVVVTADGGLLVGGSSYVSEDVSYRPTFRKFNSMGDFEWEKQTLVGNFKYARVYDMITDAENGFLAGGEIFADTTDHFNDMLLMKIDQDANTIWVKNYGAKNTEWVEDMKLTRHNRIVTVGYNQSRPPADNLQAVMVITDLEGELLVNIEEHSTKTSSKTLLFPNPTQLSTNVILSPKPLQSVHWTLYDVSGKVVNNGLTESGLFEIGVEDFQKGVYFLVFPEGQYPSMKLVVAN